MSEKMELALRNIEAEITGLLRTWEGSERGDAFSAALSVVQRERHKVSMAPKPWGPVTMPPDDELLRRAISNARPVRDVRGGVPRWKSVMDTCLLGSTYAWQLCERFGLNPDEKVRR
jgi:hypothetical protein